MEENMAFQNKPNTGAMFSNRNKKEDKHPDLKGTINLSGKEMNIAAWKRTTKSGQQFLSIKVSESRMEKNIPEKKNTQQDGLPF